MKLFVISISCLLAAFMFLGAQVNLIPGYPYAYQNTTFANSQVDTVHFIPHQDQTTLAFGAHWSDSVSVTNVILRRVVNGELTTVLAGDTILGATIDTSVAGLRGTAANPSSAVLKTITVSPKPDEYWFIVTYASTKNGVTNAKVRYEVIQSH